MTQMYFGSKKVQAWPAERDGKPGYGVKYEDGYTSWSPKEAFEKAYLPMGFFPDGHPKAGQENTNTITQQMVDDFIESYSAHTLGEKTTVGRATLKNGFEIVEASSCVDVSNYSEEIGAKICLDRIKNQVWHLLGFALQWSVTGLKG